MKGKDIRGWLTELTEGEANRRAGPQEGDRKTLVPVFLLSPEGVQAS